MLYGRIEPINLVYEEKKMYPKSCINSNLALIFFLLNTRLRTKFIQIYCFGSTIFCGTSPARLELQEQKKMLVVRFCM